MQAAERELAFVRESASRSRRARRRRARPRRPRRSPRGRPGAPRRHRRAGRARARLRRGDRRPAAPDGRGEGLAESTRSVIDARLDAVLAVIDARLAGERSPCHEDQSINVRGCWQPPPSPSPPAVNVSLRPGKRPRLRRQRGDRPRRRWRNRPSSWRRRARCSVDRVLAPAVLALDETRTVRMGSIMTWTWCRPGCRSVTACAPARRWRSCTATSSTASASVPEGHRRAAYPATEAAFALQNEARAERLLGESHLSAGRRACEGRWGRRGPRHGEDRSAPQKRRSSTSGSPTAESDRRERRVQCVRPSAASSSNGSSLKARPSRLERRCSWSAISARCGPWRKWTSRASPRGRPDGLSVPRTPGEPVVAKNRLHRRHVDPTTGRVTVRAVAERRRPAQAADVRLGRPRRRRTTPRHGGARRRRAGPTASRRRVQSPGRVAGSPVRAS